jgi:hypothetical protein
MIGLIMGARENKESVNDVTCYLYWMGRRRGYLIFMQIDMRVMLRYK